MPNTTAYTPLESLFLFQSLAKYGFVPGAFNRISDDLSRHALVREQESYDAGRLSPELLEQLARHLVREEQTREAEAAEKATTNGGNVSPTSRKRKLPTPPLPSLKELQAQSDKLPLLVDRLYARYRDDIVRQIREDEQKIDKLQRDIQDLEAADTASKVSPKQESKAPTTNGTVSPQDTKTVKPVRPNGHVSQTPIPVPTPPQSQVISKPAPVVAPTPVPPPVPERKTPQPQPSPSPLPSNTRPATATTPARPSEIGRTPSGPSSGLQHPQTAQNYGPPPPALATPQSTPVEGLQRPETLRKSQSPAPKVSPQPQQPPGHPQPQTPGTLKWEPLYRPQQTPVPSPRLPYTTPIARPPSHQGQPLVGTPQPAQQLHQSHPGSKPSPQNPAQQPHTQPVRPPSQGAAQANPGLAHPQNVVQRPPSLPLQAPDGSVQPQYRAPTVPVSAAPSSGVPVPQLGQHPAPIQPARTPVRPPAVAPQLQTPGRGHTGPPHIAGTRPPLATPAQHAQLPHSQATPSTPAAAPSTPGAAAARRPFTPSHPIQPHSNIQPAISTDLPQRSASQAGRLSTAALPPIHTPSQPYTPTASSFSSHVIRGHGTKWTSTPTPATPKVEVSGYFDSQSPVVEPLSPPTHLAQLPKTSPLQSGRRDARKSMHKIDTSTPKVQSRLAKSAQKETPSHVEETKIKDEEATPRPFEDAGDTTADESVPGRALGSASKAGSKRKREASPAVPRAPSDPSTHVLWTRSFHKVSASALEQVISHRHANMFAHPIKARDAPGYPELILSPQDLKGIRTAINQGQKAAHAAERNMPDADLNAMNVWLPKSIDLIPPKGIINIAQLERELVHMFANAIMYNADPDRGVGPSFIRQNEEDDNEEIIGYEVDENGIVKETRNMFAEVEKLMSDLRSEIERNAQPRTGTHASVSRGVSVAGGEVSAVEEDADETGGDTDVHGTAKRRRVRG